MIVLWGLAGCSPAPPTKAEALAAVRAAWTTDYQDQIDTGELSCSAGCVTCELAPFHAVFAKMGLTEESCDGETLTVALTERGEREAPNGFVHSTTVVRGLISIDTHGDEASVIFAYGYEPTPLGQAFRAALPAPAGAPFLCWQGKTSGYDGYRADPTDNCYDVTYSKSLEIVNRDGKGWKPDPIGSGNWNPR
jgi:hypothetical protein